MKPSKIFPVAMTLLLAVACNDDDNNAPPRDGASGGLLVDAGANDGASDGGGSGGASDGGGSDAAGADGALDGATLDGNLADGGATADGAVSCGAPSPTCAPQLGAQIDRMGRPAVNTALTDPFWDNGTRTLEDHHAQQDRYNQASDPMGWGDVELAPGKKVRDAIKANLAAYDALDGTSDGVAAGDGCGNQLAYGATYKGTTYPDYTLLTTVLTDDRVYVNTGSGTCTTYLAVEANQLGVTNNDCGGRTPSYNTIDITYSALVTGHPVCTTMCDVSNGVTSDAEKGANFSETAFPFLGDPRP
jgi:hypothetical protein